MIQLIDNMPLVQFAGGRVETFRREWLLRSVLRAARGAGYPAWWLAEHVVDSVALYLRGCRERSAVPVGNLETAVRSVLQVIGYAEVATRFAADPPIARVNLAELAREAGEGYELLFFELLGRRLDEAAEGGARCVEIVGLSAGVKRVRACKHWTRGCDALRDEIVAFVRERAGRAGALGDFHFSLC